MHQSCQEGGNSANERSHRSNVDRAADAHNIRVPKKTQSRKIAVSRFALVISANSKLQLLAAAPLITAPVKLARSNSIEMRLADEKSTKERSAYRKSHPFSVALRAEAEGAVSDRATVP